MNADQPAADSRGKVTRLLLEWQDGNVAARDDLIAAVYQELRRLAGHYLKNESPKHTLQPTALVHEVYLRLVAGENVSWQNRAHFFACAAQLMRRLLVDHARLRLAQKRGGGALKISLDDMPGAAAQEHDVLLVHEALDRLAELDPRAARVVEARYFGGLQEEEAAEALGISLSTLKRDWKFARAWLFAELNPAEPGERSDQ